MYHSKKNILILLVCAGLCVACSGSSSSKQTDTPTSGHVKLGVDDSYKLMTDAQVYLFTHIYSNTSIDVLYDAEVNIINLFMKDSIETMIVSRPLTDQQMRYLTDRSFNARTTTIALDGIAFVLNKHNKHKNLFYDQVRDIFLGKITTWGQIDPKSAGLGKLRVLFDKNGSSNITYFQDKFKIKDFPSTFSATKSNADIIGYVEKNLNAIGLLSVNWISDPADSISHNFLSRIMVAGISKIEGSNSSTDEFYQPYQAYIYDGSYPFTRKVYFIDRQSYSGLGTGLSSFIAGEKGQTVIYRSGMVPVQMPVRVVEMRK
jgi:phosphate transport system substrate-binding protein